MAGVQALRVALLQELAVGLPAPARVERLEPHRVPRLDREHRRQLAREVAVQRAALERQLVDHARRPPIGTGEPAASYARSAVAAAGDEAKSVAKSV